MPKKILNDISIILILKFQKIYDDPRFKRWASQLRFGKRITWASKVRYG
ncbi:unnamed protein product [Thelazia callipaeda]|uniref:Mobile element protein n=1 Tax=Thelazia callipaeda TaxID=103827 RepID=A0A0N5D1K5_THECL|nr:unnamed protein product [Thelazia callipaeda]